MADRFPDVEPFGYLIHLLSRLGVAMNDGSGVHGVTWQELQAFIGSTRLTVTAWEAETIKKLSAVYANSVLKYDNRDVPAPHRSAKEQGRIASSMKSALRNVVIKRDGLSNNPDKSRHAGSKRGQR